MEINTHKIVSRLRADFHKCITIGMWEIFNWEWEYMKRQCGILLNSSPFKKKESGRIRELPSGAFDYAPFFERTEKKEHTEMGKCS